MKCLLFCLISHISSHTHPCQERHKMSFSDKGNYITSNISMKCLLWHWCAYSLNENLHYSLETLIANKRVIWQWVIQKLDAINITNLLFSFLIIIVTEFAKKDLVPQNSFDQCLPSITHYSGIYTGSQWNFVFCRRSCDKAS